VLTAPGKLVAQDTPVALKSTLGEGYSVQVTFNSIPDPDKQLDVPPPELLRSIQTFAPEADISSSSPLRVSYHLKSKESSTVENVLQLIDSQQSHFGIASYEVLGTSIEDIFLRLMAEEERAKDSEKDSETPLIDSSQTLVLTNGRPRSAFSQALTIFHKRVLVARRSWLTPLLTLLVGISASTAPLFFLNGQLDSCVPRYLNDTSYPLLPPDLPDVAANFESSFTIQVSPPEAASILMSMNQNLSIQVLPDNETFVSTIQQDYQSLSLGGISLDLQTGNSLVAWEASTNGTKNETTNGAVGRINLPPGIYGPTLVNLVTNILYNQALNSSPSHMSLIMPIYEPLPVREYPQALAVIKWVVFFGAAMAVYPAFFVLYVSRERRSSVQAMQLSNGLSNIIGLWLGHLLFDSIFVVAVTTVIIIIFSFASNQFHGTGILVKCQMLVASQT